MIKRRMMPMIYINRDNKVFTNSYESKNGIVTGTAFIGYRSLYGEDLLNYVSSWETAEVRYSLLTGPLGGENKVVGPVVF